ncbi:lipopolysaccharide heptosyltransferase II [Methylocucumis oryzae]|uniref:lipopolysaccharide heptosyltransferase II n=1 Tax=Methylocucumis oryzae TaxID=1632867 RepID=UPI000AE33CAE|nr:lipopolysaccharide heptosyltransferase II [Methylocucumis oryzae]
MAKRILIVGPSWVGDMVMAQSLFKLIKQATPDAMIDVLAPAWTLPLLNYMPEIQSGIAMPVTHGQLGLIQRYRLGRQLQQKHYTQSIVLPNSWKSALIPWFANIPLRTGFVGEWRYGLLNDYRRLDKNVVTYDGTTFCRVKLNRPHHKHARFS